MNPGPADARCATVERWADAAGIRDLLDLPWRAAMWWLGGRQPYYPRFRDSVRGFFRQMEDLDSWYGAETVQTMLGILGAAAERREGALLLMGTGMEPIDPALAEAAGRIRAGMGATGALPILLDGPFRVEADPPRLVGPNEISVDLHTGQATAPPGAPPQLIAGALLAALQALAQDHALAKDIRGVLSVPQWQRDLAALDALLQPSEDTDKPLVGWRVRTGSRPSLHPLRCREKKRGDGFVMRQVGSEELDPIRLSAADQRALSLWRRGAPHDRVVLTIEHLVGHPRVFVDRATRPVPVRRSQLTLHVEPEGVGYRIVPRLEGEELALPGLHARLEAATAAGLWLLADRNRVVLVPMSAAVIALVGLLEARRRVWPAEAASALVDRLEGLQARVRLELDPGLLGDPVDGEQRPVVQLSEVDGALHLVATVQPLPDGLVYAPGEGPNLVTGMVGGARVFVARDVDQEAERVLDALAPLELGDPEAPWTWRVTAPQRALTLMQRLCDAPHRYVSRWDRSGMRMVVGTAHARGLSIQVTPVRQWLALGGDLTVGEHRVALDALIDAVRQGDSFVRVSEQGWVRLADAFRTRLEAVLRSADEQGRVPALMAVGLAALEEEGASVQGPSDWSARVDRLVQARALSPDLPNNLDAVLRPYQHSGFVWLARLAHWAPGAVLADDMGLGKTVLAIALMLHRGGPTLVVAPTSVGFNWCRELERFAPSLEVRTYRGGGRASLLEDLGPRSVVVTSWSLLARDAEALGSQPFRTAVLDEAQAMKNAATARARAARGLSADFALLLTGTPIENHVHELWSLMQVAAPGLLGARQAFVDRFASPIAAGETRARRALADAVAPFVLRRTKGEVARDLPTRQEMLLRIELSRDERLLYDQARMRALARLEAGEARGGMAALSALTHLRQLACHPKLVDPGSTVESSKLQRVRQIVADLREGGHRILLFSSFTRHLALVRTALELDGATLLQLDGSTPAAERERLVDRFQQGEADGFLLSLKAGGTGLNLTAATYVLHLDPWWNPAAEDQATDRAHRIGQTMPVTVYRLVSVGTVEDRIVSMHQDKRTLARDVLAGSGGATSLDANTLLSLFSGD
jgi:superfamily II DNA or RNA helicase